MTRTHQKVSHLPKSNGAYTPVTAASGVEQALSMLSGRWKLLILFHLFGGQVQRFSDLERLIPDIQQLRQLEKDGMVLRIVYPTVPPKVEYQLIIWGPALDGLLAWSEEKPGG